MIVKIRDSNDLKAFSESITRRIWRGEGQENQIATISYYYYYYFE